MWSLSVLEMAKPKRTWVPRQLVALSSTNLTNKYKCNCWADHQSIRWSLEGNYITPCYLNFHFCLTVDQKLFWERIYWEHMTVLYTWEILIWIKLGEREEHEKKVVIQRYKGLFTQNHNISGVPLVSPFMKGFLLSIWFWFSSLLCVFFLPIPPFLKPLISIVGY